MIVNNVEQLASFLKARDELNDKVHDICNQHGYSACVDSWEVKGDRLVIDFSEGGTYHPMVRFTRSFPLTELLA